MEGIINYKGIIDVARMEIDVHMSKYRKLMEIAGYSLVSYFTPFLFTHPQILLGSIVNASLVMGALYARGKEIIPLIVLPSLGVLTRGLLFGPLTKYILFMIPFIWVGNAIYVLGIKYMYLKLRRPYILSIIVSALAKSLFLFVSAYILYTFSLVPSLFLVAFGVMQLITALIGGFGVSPIFLSERRRRK